MAEYIAIMVINNKTADQINAELSDLIGPEYDPDFSTWLFNAAKAPLAPPPQPPAAPPKPSRLVSQAFDAVSAGVSAGTKRGSSPARDGGPNKLRKVDAPSAPRAMRETDTSPAPTSPVMSNGGEGSSGKSLLQRIETFDSRGESGFSSSSHRDHRGGRGGYRDRDRGDRNDRQNFRQNQNQGMPPAQIPPNFVDPATFAMMDPAMMMGMNMQMNPMAFQEIIGNNMAMMQQMASMMMNMHQQHQQQAPPPPGRTLPNGPHRSGEPRKAAPATTSSLSATASAFQPTIYVQDKPASTAICKHGVRCNNARCRDSHPSPVATAESGVVLSTEVCDKGPGGSECKDQDCTKSHISPAATKPGVKVSFVPSNASAAGGDKPSTPSSTPSTTTTAAAKPAPKPTPATAPAQPPSGQVPIPCKFGAHCTRPGCHFLHPGRRGGNANSAAPCRFGAKCTRVDCSFSHPPGRTLPNQFHKGLATSTKASEAFAPAPHRTVVFNVPKKKGAEGGKEGRKGANGEGKKEDANEAKEVKEVEAAVAV